MAIEQTGISFPFRIGVNGGVVISSTSVYDVSHIEESIKQILLTHKFDRTMEPYFYSSIESFVFTKIDDSNATLLRYQVHEALQLEKRIRVDMDDIDIEQCADRIKIHIKYTVLVYETEYITTVEL
jgi:phage baseplate assembly protein W